MEWFICNASTSLTISDNTEVMNSYTDKQSIKLKVGRGKKYLILIVS